MITTKERVISVTYELKIHGTDEVIEVVKQDKPLLYIPGKGNLLSSFEEKLNDLDVGKSFDFILKAKEAYGPVNDQAIMDLPLSTFMVEGKIDSEMIKLGNTVPMRDNQGRQFNGKIIGITDDQIKMDFNHPLAGKDLNFKGEIADIREATADEITNGLYANSCGCGSEACEPSDCEDTSCDSSACGC
ncbi:MAG: FKBP-type peptidyl-prolyl cis-trans isomerase [Bacteroidetes bacterium]|nr:FKBP-type peptidyl-prolyl cis-trans isomerase [Bacteroidota bacterium]